MQADSIQNRQSKGEYGMKVVIDGDKTKNVRGNRATELLEHISALFTKEEVIAMLTEIQLEIEEIKPLKPTDDEDWQYGCFHGLTLMQDKCLRLIQQKINSLKEIKDGSN